MKLLALSTFTNLAFGYLGYNFFKENTKALNANPVQDRRKIVKVCITGAAGNVGSAFIPMLAHGEVFGQDVRVFIKMLDTPEKDNLLKGLNLELQDGAYKNLYGVEYGSNPRKLFRDSDVIVFAGGNPRHPGMRLEDLLQVNGQIFVDQAIALNDSAKPDVKCVVVTSPANTNALILKNYATRIPPENFTSLSRLAQNRATGLLAIRAGISPEFVKNIIVWGSHSDTQFPYVDGGSILGNSIRDVINNDKWIDEDFVNKIQNRGTEILETKGISSTSSAAKAIADHIKDWYIGTPDGTMTSMGVWSDGSYGIPKGLFCSMPVRTDNWNYKIVKNLLLNDRAKERLLATVGELTEQRDIIFGPSTTTTTN